MLENFICLEKCGTVHPRCQYDYEGLPSHAEDNEIKEFSEYLMRCGDGKLIIDESLGKFEVNVPNDLLF